MPFHPSDIICLSTLFIFPIQTIKYQCMPTSKYIINHTENVMFHWLYASINVFVHHFQVSIRSFLSQPSVDFGRIYWLRVDTPLWGAHSAYLNLSNLKRDADLSGKSFELIIWCQAKMFIKCWKLHILAPDVRFNIRSTQYPIILIIISTRLSTIQPIQWST